MTKNESTSLLTVPQFEPSSFTPSTFLSSDQASRLLLIMSSGRRPLSLNMSLINEMDDDVHQNLGLTNSKESNDDDDDDDILRFEGLSIGRNYLRIQGTALLQIDPQSLEMEQTLGRGSCSRVVKATVRPPQDDDKHNDSTNNDTGNTIRGTSAAVALKQISIHTSEKQLMLSKELQALAQMDCECLVKLHGAYMETNTVTLVLEYMDCGSLASLLRAGPLPDPLSAAITYQMLWGLSYLHFENRLHRDIKPANVLLHSNGSVKLSDFGISAVMTMKSNDDDDDDDASSKRMHTTFVGTTKYMALERLRRKEYSKPSDVWSLGLIVLQCVTGSFCFADLDSIVELVVTLEDMISTSDNASLLSTIEHQFSEPLRELLDGFLQIRPEKRMPASILIKSPWFESQGIESLDHAKGVVRDYMSKT